MYSLVMVTVKVSSPREQENLALQVSSVLSVEAEPPTPAAVACKDSRGEDAGGGSAVSGRVFV